MKVILVALFLAVPWAAKAQPVADGLYRSSNEASSRSVLDQDGKRLALGSAQVVAGQKRRIYSMDNANSQFWVAVAIPIQACPQAMSYILVVANQAYPSRGTGSGPGYCETDFRVLGEGNAVRVSKYLGTPIEYRRHPGHELLVSFVPVRASFRVKDEVTAKFRVENVGTNTIAFMKGGAYRGASRDNQYTFSARYLGKQVPDIGTSVSLGGIAAAVTLKPGEEFTDTVDLSRWFAFDRTGRYEILGSYSMEFVDPESHRLIWSDYVSAAFVVSIDR